MNTGNTPVQAADYQQPIVFELDGTHPPVDATIIAESTSQIASNLFAQQQNTPRPISIRPALLNRGDWFTLRMLFDNRDSRIIGRHRIVGGTPMQRYGTNYGAPNPGFARIMNTLWAIGSSAVVVVGVAIAEHWPFAKASVIGFAGVSLVPAVTALLGLIAPRNPFRKLDS